MLCRNVAIYLVAGGPPAACTRRSSSALAARGVLLLGRSERLIDPARYGLRAIGPHAYERVA